MIGEGDILTNHNIFSHLSHAEESYLICTDLYLSAGCGSMRGDGLPPWGHGCSCGHGIGRGEYHCCTHSIGPIILLIVVGASWQANLDFQLSLCIYA